MLSAALLMMFVVGTWTTSSTVSVTLLATISLLMARPGRGKSDERVQIVDLSASGLNIDFTSSSTQRLSKSATRPSLCVT
jgi:hypothetical protein